MWGVFRRKTGSTQHFPNRCMQNLSYQSKHTESELSILLFMRAASGSIYLGSIVPPRRFLSHCSRASVLRRWQPPGRKASSSHLPPAIDKQHKHFHFGHFIFKMAAHTARKKDLACLKPGRGCSVPLTDSGWHRNKHTYCSQRLCSSDLFFLLHSTVV